MCLMPVTTTKQQCREYWDRLVESSRINMEKMPASFSEHPEWYRAIFDITYSYSCYQEFEKAHLTKETDVNYQRDSGIIIYTK